MRYTSDLIKSGLKWCVGNGDKIKFWNDNWLGDFSIRNLIKGPLNYQEEHIKISSLINQGFWNLNIISFSFPINLSNKIFGTSFNLTNKEDKLVWGFSKFGYYIIKSANFALLKSKPVPGNTNFNWI